MLGQKPTMKAYFLVCAFGLATLATAIPSEYEDDLVFRRAVNDKCKAPTGTGSCQRTANCPGISYPTNLCPKDPNNVQVRFIPPISFSRS